MTYPKGDRGECLKHSIVRCSECAYVAELEEENRNLIEEIGFLEQQVEELAEELKALEGEE